MAIVGQAQEIAEARGKTVADDGTRNYTRRYLVRCDDVADDANVALTATGLPQRYFGYATDTSQDQAARATSITAKQVPGSYLLWHVDVEYSTKHGDQQKEQQEQDNPLLALPDIEWSFETIQQPIWFYPNQTVGSSTAPGHLFSGPLVTSAGEVFDPPPMYDESRPVVTIRRNESQFNVSLAVQYQNAVNSDFFFGVQPRCAKLRSISASQQNTKGVFYWQVTYVIAFRRESWDLRMLNYGSFALAAAGSTETTPFKSKDGSLRYGLLKTDGTAVSATAFTSTDVNILTYRIHVEKPFSSLNLPLNPNRT